MRVRHYKDLRLAAFTAILLLSAPAFADGDQSLAIAFRFGERFTVTLSGVLLLFLGYKLFQKNTELGSLNAEIPDKLKLQIQRVGPGVFFAVFGTVLLVYVMTSTIEVDIRQDPSKNTASSEKQTMRLSGFVADSLSDKEKSAQLARALALIKTYLIGGGAPTTAESQNELQDAIILVDAMIGDFVDSAVGKGAYAKYIFTVSQMVANPNYLDGLDDNTRSEFMQVQEILESSL